jgi:hypothetical protein
LWPIEHLRPVGIEQAILSARFLLRSLAASGSVGSLGLVLRTGGTTETEGWLVVHSMDGQPELPKRLTGAAMDWLGTGPGVPFDGLEPIVVDRGVVFHAEVVEARWQVGTPPGGLMMLTSDPAPAVTGGISTTTSATWRLLSASTHRWQLTLMFDPGFSEADQVDLGLSVVGSGDELGLVAPLIEADAAGEQASAKLVPEFLAGRDLKKAANQARQAVAPSVGLVPKSVAGSLLALPARIETGWPMLEAAPETSLAVITAAEHAVPPHVLIQGGSGLGKTTTLDHLVRASARVGATVLVVCPHGDLARKAAAGLTELGTPHRVVDFGAEEPIPWNLSVPDSGVGPEQHASLMLSVIQGLWAGGDEGWFGPVWTRIMRAVLGILVRDPAGPWPLTRLPDLLEVRSRLRSEALGRIGDRVLEQVINLEPLPMLTSRDPDNLVAWIVSKIDPLIGDPTMRAIIGSGRHAFDFDRLLAGGSLVVSVPERRLTSEEGPAYWPGCC